MGKDRYEFTYMSEPEKRKVFAIKTILLVSILFSLWSLVDSDNRHLSSAYYDAAWVLAAIFAYINTLQIRSEITELFEHPLEYHGKEFMMASLVAFVFGLYTQFF